MNSIDAINRPYLTNLVSSVPSVEAARFACLSSGWMRIASRKLPFFALLILGFLADAQTYNDVVSDSVVHSFMKDVLFGQDPGEYEFNKLPKKIYRKVVHIGMAPWDMSSAEGVSFEVRFRNLYKYDTLLSGDDFEFIKEQYLSIKDTTWAFSFKGIKLKKKYKRREFVYSAPLFSQDFKVAVLWRYYFRGPTWARSELHIYKWSEAKQQWMIAYLVAGWIA